MTNHTKLGQFKTIDRLVKFIINDICSVAFERIFLEHTWLELDMNETFARQVLLKEISEITPTFFDATWSIGYVESYTNDYHFMEDATITFKERSPITRITFKHVEFTSKTGEICKITSNIRFCDREILYTNIDMVSFGNIRYDWDMKFYDVGTGKRLKSNIYKWINEDDAFKSNIEKSFHVDEKMS